MSDIFISYSRTDAPIASKLERQLRGEGWTVFMDRHIDAGHRWATEIEGQLARARAVLTLWSSNSLQSRFVMDEADDAANRGIIFPVRIEAVPIPFGFRQFQTPDLIPNNGATEIDAEQWQLLVTSLRRHLNRRPAQPNYLDASEPAPPIFFRDNLRIGGEGPLMVVISAGCFRMGFPPDEPERQFYEDPLHEVGIAEPFGIGVYAVNFDEYDYFCDNIRQAKPLDQGWGRGRRPVINVSWEQAQKYCEWLSEQTGRAYRLPSEAEWEYAVVRALIRHFIQVTRIITDQANFNGDYIYNGSAKSKYRKQTVPVGTFAPNAFGLCEMHGNVWEWCQDNWHWNYENCPQDASPWERGGSEDRVLRGGCWSSDPASVRSGKRNRFSPADRYNTIGFRLACAIAHRDGPVDRMPVAPVRRIQLVPDPTNHG